MKEIKVGDEVRVTKSKNPRTLDWCSGHKEGVFEVIKVDKDGDYELKDGHCNLWYDSTWCELTTPKIDLTKPQLIEGDVKVRVWNNNMNKGDAVERYLALISPDCFTWCWFNGYTGGYYNYMYGEDKLCFWDNAELIEEPPKPKTRLMTRREIKAKILSMDKDNPFLVGFFDGEEHIKTALEKEWKIATSVILHHYKIEAHYYRHIHPITGEWTSEPSQFLIKEGE